MKKHTILIFSQAMELGGVERSLLGLLDSIDYDRYDVAYINRLQKGIWLLLKAICAYISAYIERLEQLYLCSAVS